MICASCGKEIGIGNARYLNGKAYGSTCYKRELTLIYKKFEEVKNEEYSKQCFSAVEVLKTKTQSNFSKSIINQYEECKKLTAKQLSAIVKMLSPIETVKFYTLLWTLGNEKTQRQASRLLVITVQCNKLTHQIMNDEEINNVILSDVDYRMGFYYMHDVEDLEKDVFIMSSGKDESKLNESLVDEYDVVVKIVKA